MYSTLTLSEFWNTYKPEENKFSLERGQEDHFAYETYGEELDYVLSVANDPERGDKYVWTEVDGDEGTYIISGYHLVNRIQYYICEVPNASPKYQEAVVDLSKECHCHNEDGDADPTCEDCEGGGYYPIAVDTREQLIEIYGAEYANAEV